MNTVAPALASRGRIGTAVQSLSNEVRRSRSRRGPGVLTSVYGSGTTQRTNNFTVRKTSNTTQVQIPSWG